MLEQYKLFLNWEGLHYTEGVAVMTKAWFSGPVLTQVQKIDDNDQIDLDFSEQNNSVPLFLPEGFFIATLSWKQALHLDNQVDLVDCYLSHNKAGSLKELPLDGTILIDCSKHEHYIHAKFLTYPAWVITKDKEIIGG